MKKDLSTREDIEFLIRRFYDKVLSDDKIGYIFTDIAKIDLEAHVPVIVSFWESVILDAMTYKNNVILKHIELNKKERLTKDHFSRWRTLFEETIDEHFEGEHASLAKKRASVMEKLMLYKIENSMQEGFLY